MGKGTWLVFNGNMFHVFCFCWLLGLHLEIPVAKVIRVIHQDDMQPPLTMDTQKVSCWISNCKISKLMQTSKTRWWFQIFLLCSSLFGDIWGRFAFWLLFLQMGWNHQPEKDPFQKRIQIFWGCFDALYIIFDHLTHQPWIFCEQQNFAAHLHKKTNLYQVLSY